VYIAFSILVIIFLATPTTAFSADSLTIIVDGGGSASVTFRYSLSWFEDVVVFLRVADPARELKSALEKYSGEPVNVVAVTEQSASFSIPKFASVTEKDSMKVYTTPELHFEDANLFIQTYWFAPLVHADFSPSVTVIIFPDGYTETFQDIEVLPSRTHPQVIQPSLGDCGCGI